MFKVEAVVIGAGVIGLTIARALALRGFEVLVLEAAKSTGQGQSSRNSEVIHAGLHYAPGSLKARLCVAGRRALYRYCSDRGIPHRCCGKLIVAANEREDATLEILERQAKTNGVEGVELIRAGRLKELEPEIRGTAALASATTGIVDCHALMLAYRGDAEDAGATFSFRTPVRDGTIVGDSILIRTSGAEPAEIEARLVINAAGLGAWDVSARLIGLDAATIPPRYLAKGNYFSLKGCAPFKHLIYPVPDPGGLGIHLTLDLGGQARFGPDVEWVNEVDYEVDPLRGAAFYNAIRRYWPALEDGVLSPAYAGIRARTAGPGEQAPDFVIQGPPETGHRGYIALYGIESPGLTASLAISEHVAELAASSP
ncbi:MAG: NAD(P)/FAD-dependent oxidoreductase [Methyloceanibacter sp.]